MADDAPDDGPGHEQPHHDEPHHDDPYALGDDPSFGAQLWVMTRIILATLLILIGFALVVGIVFRLT